MAKAIPTSCFRQKPEVTNLKQFNVLLEIINLEGKRYIFVVDIDFDKNNKQENFVQRSLLSYI